MRPCRPCPWRKDAPRGVWTEERFLSLAATCQGDGLAIFACHLSSEEKPRVCAGWAAVVGEEAPGQRIAIYQGDLDPSRLDTAGVELFASFDEMLAANGIKGCPNGRAGDGFDHLRMKVLACLPVKRR